MARIRGICSVEGCGKPHSCKGYCGTHYSRFKRNGDVELRLLYGIPALIRFLRKVEKSPGCWEWRGSLSSRGYGQFRDIPTGAHTAHVFSYRVFVGEIPEGLSIDHVCMNKLCVKPSHLEAVTPKENTRRFLATKPRVPECWRGHPLEGEGVYVGMRPDGRIRRDCRECQRIRRAEEKARRGWVDV